MEFDWDSGNIDHATGHGVSIEDIEFGLVHNPLIRPDPYMADIERRWRAISLSQTGRHVFVVFTVRHKDGHAKIRPISARFLHQKEIEKYERQK